ncbi:PAS domain S-box protein [Natronomonas salina]|uniref:PAS domain S-box protein n=1 Tax=Natronomonas salina TaxID=1710540 RepID=UPI0015B3FB6B|nr:PAS domain S-box protein [Natronomonas salina]QLD90165.1 PAS domain S-box protein [Natronomonas salina]
MSTGIRVLHVDDDDLFRDLATRHLEREGLDVTTVGGASSALDALEEVDVDCVVSDFDMPGADGLELLEAVRERDPDLPFVLFTGKGSEEIASEAISAGVTDYLQKETNSDQFALLANRIERAVTERRTEEALEESERMLSTLVSNLPGVVYRCRNEPGWPMEYVGGNVEEVTGYEANDFLDGDVSWGELIVEEDREEMWETTQRALEAREAFEVTYRITDADGETRWLREQGQGVFAAEDADEPVALEGFITDVTGRKRRERELVEYDRLVDAMGDPVYTTDAAGRITTFNERAEAVTGYDADDLLGEHVSTLLSREDIERGEAVIRELLGSDDGTATYELAVRTADGDEIDLENHVALLTHDGEFHGTIGVLRSRTDRTDNRLRRLHDATRKLMGETDPERIAELTVEAAREILELPVASVRFAREDALELVAVTEPTVDTMGERPPFPVDDSVAGEVFRAGEPRVEPDLHALEKPIDPGAARSAAYFPLGEHGVFIAAATERDAFDEGDIRLATVLAANAEAALDRAHKEAALRRERDDLAALFENIPDPTVETLMAGGRPIVQRVNPAFEDVFGYSNEEIHGADLDDFIVPEEHRDVAREHNERIEGGDGFHDEVRRLADDGLRDFILHVVPHDVGEASTRGYAIYTDITDQKQRERKLERQNERLDQFASVVSHDLRNPLSVARGRLDLAEMTGEAEHFEAVERAHDRMDELINGLLALARQGELANDPIPVDVENAAETAWDTAETGDLALSLDDPPTVDADPDRLRQLLENVFRNADQHGGDGASTVTVGSLPNGDGFYVADDGEGIPEAERETVLQSGYSGADGTGFGLAIAETIAEAHGWRIAVTESDEGGARFEFRDDPALDGD